MKKNWFVEGKRYPEENENHRGPRGNHPLDGKLKVEQRHDSGGAKVRHEHVEVQAAVARDGFFFLRQLGIDEIQNKDQRENRVDAGTPEFAGLTCREVREEDAREGGNQRKVSLIAELCDFAKNAVFKEDQTEYRPAHRNAEGLQLVPKQQRNDNRSRPGIDVVQVALTPLLRHTDDARKRVQNQGDDSE